MLRIARTGVCIVLLAVPFSVGEVATASRNFNIDASTSILFAPVKKTWGIAKVHAPTKADAILAAQKKHPGWKVIKVTDLPSSWNMILEKIES